MRARHRLGTVILLSCLAVTAIGCQRKGERSVPAEVQSASVQPANQPTTINGCLKAGDASDTFVVTAARTEGSTDTATYQLLNNAGVNLADHVGRQVQVSGVIRQTQELASRDRAQPSQPVATQGSGKPAVETRTEVDIKRLEVSAIKRLGDRCE